MISWLFEIDSLRLSTKDVTWSTTSYSGVIIPDSFSGITMRWDISGNGLIAPNEMEFEVSNTAWAYTTSSFDSKFCIIRLIEDGTNTRTWKFKIDRAISYYGKITCYCIDFLQEHLTGDYPNTKSQKEIWPSDDFDEEESYSDCVPVVLGTAYIPVKSVNTGTERWYVLGESGPTYTVHEVMSSRSWPNSSTWLSSEYTMTGGVNSGYQLLQPIIADSDDDDIADAVGLWKSGDTFYDMLCKFSRNDTASLTNPADWIEYILEDFGVSSSDIDAVSFGAAATLYSSLAIVFNGGGWWEKESRESVLSNILAQTDSFLKCTDKVELYQFDATPVETITDVLLLSFSPSKITKSTNDSGRVHWPESTTSPSDVLNGKATVPSHNWGAETTTSSDILECRFLSGDSISAQKAGILYFQKKFEQSQKINFSVTFPSLSSKATISPGQVVTINNALYGGSNNVIITDMTINPDMKVDFSGVILNYLEDWNDLSPAVISVVEDTSVGFDVVDRYVRLSTDGLIFHYDSDNLPSPDPQTITVIATALNIDDSSFTFSTIPNVKSQTSASNEFTLSTTDMGVNDSVNVMVSCDNKTDSVTITKVFDGSSGVTAQTIRLSATSQVFSVSSSGVSTPNSIDVTANLQNIIGTITWTISPSITTTAITDGKRITYENMGSNTAVTLTATIDNVSDTITIVKVVDGSDGSDGYTVLLTNEAHTYPADETGNITGGYTPGYCQVNVYNGTTKLTCTSTSTSTPTVNGEYRVTAVSVTSGTMSISSGIVSNQYEFRPTDMSTDYVTVQLTIVAQWNNIDTTFTKTISYSKSKTGTSGSDGTSIASVVNYYAINNSSITAPTTWYTTVQTPTSTNKYLWNYERINYSSGSYEDTDASVIGTYVKDGVGISSVTEQYALSTSNSTVTGTWSSSVPTLTSTNKYLWNKETINYTDNTSSTTTPVVIGVYGDTGAAGEDGVSSVAVLLSNPANVIPADGSGIVITGGYSGSGTTITLYEGTTSLTYDGVGTSSGTWKVTATGSSITPGSITDSGTYATVADASSMTADQAYITFAIAGKRVSGQAISISVRQNFTKAKYGSRAGGIFTFEESTAPYITATDAGYFTGTTLTNTTAAQNVARDVIAASDDGYIRPNDRITVTDNSASKAGTRIYVGSGTNSYLSVSYSDFSALVVETFDGSVIVTGTLSADKLAANTTLVNNLNVGSTMTLNSTGSIFTTGKTSYESTTAGIWMGYSSGYKINIGGSANYLKWTGSSLEIAGSITISNPAAVRTTLNVADGADVTSANTSANTNAVNGTAAATVVSNAAAGAAHAVTAHAPSNADLTTITSITNALNGQSLITTGVIKNSAGTLLLDFDHAYMQVNSANGLIINSAGGLKIAAGGGILFLGKSNNPGSLLFSGSSGITSMGVDESGLFLCTWPSLDASNNGVGIGYRPTAIGSTSSTPFDYIYTNASFGNTMVCGSKEIRLTSGGVETVGTITPSVTNTYNLGSTTRVWSSIYATTYYANYLYHTGDADTYISFLTDNIKITAGGVDAVSITATGIDTGCNIIPTANNTYDLGSILKKMKAVHAVAIYRNGTALDVYDDLYELSKIQSKKKKNELGEKISEEILNEKGMPITDPLSLPVEFTNYDDVVGKLKTDNGDLITQEDIDILIQDDDEAGWMLTIDFGLLSDLTTGAVRQLDTDMISMFNLLAERITVLENKEK